MTTMEDIRWEKAVAEKEENELFLKELVEDSDEMRALKTGTETRGFGEWVELVDGTELPAAWDVYDIKVKATRDGEEVEFIDSAEITCFIEDEEMGIVDTWFDLCHLERAGYQNIDVLAWKQQAC